MSKEEGPPFISLSYLASDPVWPQFLPIMPYLCTGAMVPLGTALVVVAVAGCIGACQENLALLKLVSNWLL